MICVGVEFKKNGKQYIFDFSDVEVSKDDNVIVETERGLQFGTAVSLYENLEDGKEHSKVIKVATKKDEEQNKKNIEEANIALSKAQELADEFGLEMKFLESYYTFDRKQLVFQFLSDNRVDFRELAKSLAAIYKTRIELRQVGVRDKAKEISGIGPCGRKLCCSSFLSDLDSVSINQVKNQNLALNPNKINGLCGRLLCCLKYEDELYKEYRKDLPEVGDPIHNNGEDGTVVSLDIPNRKYIYVNENGDKNEVKVPLKNERRSS